jgi:FkbM family methyltransferase
MFLMTDQDRYSRISKERQLHSNNIEYLRNLKASGFEPKVIYDIGANFLHWTHEAEEIWPDAEIILFEAFDKLKYLYDADGYMYHIGLLSNSDTKEVKFYYSDEYPGGNSYFKEYNDAVFPEDRYMVMKTERLDTIVSKYRLPLPDLVKISVQGSERDIIEGGINTIGHAKHLITKLQTSNYNLNAPFAQECIPYIESHGWKCIAPLFCNYGPDGNYGFTRGFANAPTICLNMIVKDESHIIEKTLTMLCQKIHFDYWVICDTGSSDNTPQIITEFFHTRNIPGKLYHDTWENFAHNRTLALNYAYGKTDLLLIFDADDELYGEVQLPPHVLFDEYKFKFGTPETSTYARTLMINNRKRFEFLSVIHEFISCKEPGDAKSTVLDGNYHVVSGRGGNRNKNPNKYLDDARILEKAHAVALKNGDPLYKRYSFYCANSYKDAGDMESAIKWYKVTLQQDNWVQEKYVSCINLYDCYANLQFKEAGFYYLVEAFKYDNERVECLNHLLVHYCCEQQYTLAHSYFMQVKGLYERIYAGDPTLILEDKLFSNIHCYYFYVPYIMIIICDYAKDHTTGIKMFEIIFDRKPTVFSKFHIKNLMFNLKFYIQHIQAGVLPSFIAKLNSYLLYLQKNGCIFIGMEDILVQYTQYGVITDELFKYDKPERSPNLSKEVCATSRNILLFTGYADEQWNCSYMKTHSLGGSEKAVIYISEILATRGYTVYVSGNVADEITEKGVIYIHMDRLPNNIPFHTVVLSRYLFFLENYPHISFHQLFVWSHDTYLLPYGTKYDNSIDIVEKWNTYIDRCICLTEWQREKYVALYPKLADKIRIINNGVQYHQVRGQNTLVKQNNKFIYTSCSERGLKILLDLWPRILQKLPDAELVISSYNAFPKSPEDDEMVCIMEKYPESIHHLGKLSGNELYEQIRSAEYWLYPCTFNETSCITALEMLAGEVICLYYPTAGLPYTMGGCGIQINPGTELETLFSLTNEAKEQLRREGVEYVSNCTWENRADVWVDSMLSH